VTLSAHDTCRAASGEGKREEDTAHQRSRPEGSTYRARCVHPTARKVVSLCAPVFSSHRCVSGLRAEGATPSPSCARWACALCAVGTRGRDRGELSRIRRSSIFLFLDRTQSSGPAARRGAGRGSRYKYKGLTTAVSQAPRQKKSMRSGERPHQLTPPPHARPHRPRSALTSSAWRRCGWPPRPRRRARRARAWRASARRRRRGSSREARRGLPWRHAVEAARDAWTQAERRPSTHARTHPPTNQDRAAPLYLLWSTVSTYRGQPRGRRARARRPAAR
jgi:hypothetical protein